ncbi:hypothetical protein D3C72_808370 [compost metagenome]
MRIDPAQAVGLVVAGLLELVHADVEHLQGAGVDRACGEDQVGGHAEDEAARRRRHQLAGGLGEEHHLGQRHAVNQLAATRGDHLAGGVILQEQLERARLGLGDRQEDLGQAARAALVELEGEAPGRLGLRALDLERVAGELGEGDAQARDADVQARVAVLDGREERRGPGDAGARRELVLTDLQRAAERRHGEVEPAQGLLVLVEVARGLDLRPAVGEDLGARVPAVDRAVALAPEAGRPHGLDLFDGEALVGQHQVALAFHAVGAPVGDAHDLLHERQGAVGQAHLRAAVHAGQHVAELLGVPGVAELGRQVSERLFVVVQERLGVDAAAGLDLVGVGEHVADAPLGRGAQVGHDAGQAVERGAHDACVGQELLGVGLERGARFGADPVRGRVGQLLERGERARLRVEELPVEREVLGDGQDQAGGQAGGDEEGFEQTLGVLLGGQAHAGFAHGVGQHALEGGGVGLDAHQRRIAGREVREALAAFQQRDDGGQSQSAAAHLHAGVGGQRIVGILVQERPKDHGQLGQFLVQVEAGVLVAAGGHGERAGAAERVEALGDFLDALFELGGGERF